MADIDPEIVDATRWLNLVTAWRDALHDGPPPLLIQQSYSAAAQAQADLDRFRARGPTGHGDRRNSPADVVANFDRGIGELEARLVERQREADRVAARSKACAQRANELRHLVDGVREWAKAQSITLPGDDDRTTVTGLTGFSEGSVHIATPSSGRELAPPLQR